MSEEIVCFVLPSNDFILASVSLDLVGGVEQIHFPIQVYESLDDDGYDLVVWPIVPSSDSIYDVPDCILRYRPNKDMLEMYKRYRKHIEDRNNQDAEHGRVLN